MVLIVVRYLSLGGGGEK